MIDKLLEQSGSLSVNSAQMTNLVDKVLTSKKYILLVNEISKEAQSFTLDRTRVHHPQSHIRDSCTSSAHSTNTVTSSSLGSLSSGVCPKENELTALSNQLRPDQLHHVRFNAAQVLVLFSVADLVADEFWKESREAMQLALVDSDTAIGLHPT